MTDHTHAMDESADALPVLEIVSALVAIIGKKLTTYAAGVKDTRTIDLWMRNGIRGLDKRTEDRLRFLYGIVKMLREHDSPDVIQGWLVGMSPELGDRAVLRVLRQEPLEIAAPLILNAARTFAAVG